MATPKKTERTNGTYLPDGKNLKTLHSFLCDLARTKKTRELAARTCRTCEVGCAFGREYARKFEAEQAKPKPPKPKKDGNSMENERIKEMEKALKVQEAEILTERKERKKAQEQLRDARQLVMDMQMTINGMNEKHTQMEQELAKAQKAITDITEQRAADRMIMIRLKARLWDMEHKDDADF